MINLKISFFHGPCRQPYMETVVSKIYTIYYSVTFCVAHMLSKWLNIGNVAMQAVAPFHEELTRHYPLVILFSFL